VTKKPRKRIAINASGVEEIDITTHDIRDSQGRRIDNQYVDDAVAFAHEVMTARVGRPSLTGHASRSPQVSFRLTPEMKEAAEHLAASRDVSVSTLARQALAQLLENEAGT
jgi:hypothetical protein